MKNNKAFTLIELLAVIVVLGIIMLIAVTSVSGVIEKSKKDAFVATARAYINAARQKVLTDNIALPTADDDYIYVYLDKTMVEKGGITSPYGRDYILLPDATRNQTTIDTANASMATAISNVMIYCYDVVDGSCVFSYWVFLSDGEKTTGCYDDTYDNAGNSDFDEKELNSSSVVNLASCGY